MTWLPQSDELDRITKKWILFHYSSMATRWQFTMRYQTHRSEYDLCENDGKSPLSSHARACTRPSWSEIGALKWNLNARSFEKQNDVRERATNQELKIKLQQFSFIFTIEIDARARLWGTDLHRWYKIVVRIHSISTNFQMNSCVFIIEKSKWHSTLARSAHTHTHKPFWH